jgi:hypothetical protein
MKLFLFLGLAVIQLLLTVLSVEDVADVQKPFPKILTPKGWIFLCLGIMSLIFTAALYYKTDEDEKNKQNLFARTQAQRDNTHHVREDSMLKEYERKIDSSYTKSITASNKALADWNIVLVDSMRKVSNRNRVKAVSPQLSIAPVSTHNPIFFSTLEGKSVLAVQFQSSNATSYLINLDCFILAPFPQHPENSIFLKKQKLFDADQFITPGRTITTYVENDISMEKYEKLIIVVVGKFATDEDRKNIIPYKEARSFDVKLNTVTRTPVNYDTLFNEIRERKLTPISGRN